MFVLFVNLGKVENGNSVESDPADGDGHHEDALHKEGFFLSLFLAALAALYLHR